MKISILNAGQQTDYLYGLVSGLSQISELEIEVVDSDRSIGVFDKFSNVKLFNLRGDNISQNLFIQKSSLILRYYFRLLSYTINTSSKVFHIQWENNSIAWFDRTLLILYYKLFRKKIVYTSHNIFREERDGKATYLSYLSLKIMYNLVDKIIVHTSKMKEELCEKFYIDPKRVGIIEHGINNRISRTGLSKREARKKLGVDSSAKIILFFGQIDEYKGVDSLINAFGKIVYRIPEVLLLIAGQSKRKSRYIEELETQIKEFIDGKKILACFQYIPVEDVETYFTAADCLVLPYRKIYQSGVIFLAYRFGIPIIATDVGSFKDDIIDGVTGYIYERDNQEDLILKIEKYFSSKLYRSQEQTRKNIIEFAERKYSWKDISYKTYQVYKNLLKS